MQVRAPSPIRLTRRLLLLVSLPIAVALLASCSADRAATDAGSAGATAPGTGESADGDDAALDESGESGGSGADAAPEIAPVDATLTDQIVRTGDVSVDVDDVTSAANRVTALVVAAGGEVGSDQRFGDGEDASADLVVRVPPDRFDELLESIADLGEEVSRSVAAEDVSAVVADVDARVESLQGSVDRLRALAAQAVSVSDLITIESELTFRQSELESLQAQQRALADQVSLATLSVRLSTSEEAVSEDSGFLTSLAAGWNALLAAGQGLISVVGLLLPWLVLFGVIGLVLLLVLRRRRRVEGLAPANAAVSSPEASEPARPPV